MQDPVINQTVLMSGADFMSNASPINPYMHQGEPFNRQKAMQEHQAIQKALEDAGITVVKVDPPADCQDGIFTANWALTRGGKALMSHLPNARQAEEAYAAKMLGQQGLELHFLPEDIRFSGQGDALPCGDYVFAGTGYRTDPAAHTAISEILGYKVIPLQTIPARDNNGTPIINQASGWPDSDFYDIDLAIAILRWPTLEQKGLVAWCPDAFEPASQATMRSLDFVDLLEVPLQEAAGVSACNLVSSGYHVIMNAGAPTLQAAIEKAGLSVTTLSNKELAKNGGSVRCCSVTLDN